MTLHPSAEPEMGDGRKEVMLSLLTLKEIENTEKQILQNPAFLHTKSKEKKKQTKIHPNH